MGLARPVRGFDADFVPGWRIFDGTGADAAVGDVVIERDGIVDVGVGLDGDVAVD